MKLEAVTLSLVMGGATAFVKPSVNTVQKSSTALNAGDKLQALPWVKEPPLIGDGTLAGDDGFDPFGLSKLLPLSWCRAAELKHGRVCMLAALGLVTPELVQNPAGFNGFHFAPEFSETNAYKALAAVPKFGLAQIVLLCGLIEVATFSSNLSQTVTYDDNLSNIEKLYIETGRDKFLAGSAKPQATFKDSVKVGELEELTDKQPGDLGWDPLGFADNGINPFYEEAELKHCRLAMVGTLGMLLQSFYDGDKGIIAQTAEWATGASA